VQLQFSLVAYSDDAQQLCTQVSFQAVLLQSVSTLGDWTLLFFFVAASRFFVVPK
jgi:hypothetical protein